MAVLRRLDRLTREEAQVTVAQTLEIVQGLVSNMKVVMDGAPELYRLPTRHFPDISLSRRSGFNRGYSSISQSVQVVVVGCCTGAN